MQTSAIRCSTLEKILSVLGMSLEDLQGNSSDTPGTFRVEFENQFAIELEALTQHLCRISARLCQLGKSQIVQNSQIERALGLFSEIFGLDQLTLSLAVSRNDNCLRLICELNDTDASSKAPNGDALFNSFEEFSYNAFAFKQTFLKHQTEKSPE